MEYPIVAVEVLHLQKYVQEVDVGPVSHLPSPVPRPSVSVSHLVIFAISIFRRSQSLSYIPSSNSTVFTLDVVIPVSSDPIWGTRGPSVPGSGPVGVRRYRPYSHFLDFTPPFPVLRSPVSRSTTSFSSLLFPRLHGDDSVTTHPPVWTRSMNRT